MTEHANDITIDELRRQLEPVSRPKLREGSIIEVAKVLKNAELLMQYVVGVAGEDEDTQDAIHELRASILHVRDRILGNALSSNADVDVQFSRLLVAVDYLVDLISPENLTAVSDALVSD